MSATPPLWKASVTLPKDRASDAAAVFQLAPPVPQAILIGEDPFGPDSTVEALYDTPPDAEFLTRLIGSPVTVEPLPDQDWIRQSQLGLPPVRAGRFFLYGAHDAGEVPPGRIPIRIEAGLAFGTGHHETTTLCLVALSQLAKGHNFSRVLDLGCGTGVLALAAAKLWRKTVLAGDIDQIAVEVARENAWANTAGPLVRAFVCDGLDHSTIRAKRPFDLIVANILAGPLTKFAPAIAAALKPGGIAVLSGLLRDQENMVLNPYRVQGMVLRHRLRAGPWSALVLEKLRR